MRYAIPFHGQLRVPPISWTIHYTVLEFIRTMAYPEFIRFGQFTWRRLLMGEVEKRYLSLLAGDAATASLLTGVEGTPNPRALMDRILASILSWKPTIFETLVSAGAAKLKGVPPAQRGPNHAAVLYMFEAKAGRWGTGAQLYLTVDGLFTQGRRFRTTPIQPNDPDLATDRLNYKTYFEDPTMAAFRILQLVSDTCADKCGTVFDHVNAYIDRRTNGRGLRRLKRPGPLSPKPMLTGAQLNRFPQDLTLPRTTPQSADVLTYGPSLGGTTKDGRTNGAIWAAKANLDAGLLVGAHVVSGISATPNAGDPLGMEHWLGLLAYEETPYGCKFVVWDPDSFASKREAYGEGFALLHYVTGAVAATRGGPGGLGHLHAHGRLTTEDVAGGIRCNSDGDHIDGQSSFKQHRYQVGALVPYATTFGPTA
jgi:hypothetical protein